jgi:dUTP pyrophosphatase
MKKPYFKIKLLNKQAFLPSKRDEDAGFDLYAIHEEDFFLLKPGGIHMFTTGISIEIPKDWVFSIYERSSTGTKGIATRCGIIDSGFRGEIFIPINNTANKPIIFAKHEDYKLDLFLAKNELTKENVVIYPTTKAIAQGMLLYSPHIEIKEVEELNDSERGDGAIGSTGK